MKTIEVFDPAMCCSTGVCGPSIDPALVRFAADLDWLAARGVPVERFNLAQQPSAFAEREIVNAVLREKGEECLPLVLADGKVVSEGGYPSRAELAGWAGIEQPAGTKSLPLVSSNRGCCDNKQAEATARTKSDSSSCC
jgi:hypothetical protein